jgi:hypothetical protein
VVARELPARPNLEHLKKQAKDLLNVLQQSDASLQLADAQHELAREYGFASWPRLKAHAEAVMSEAPPRRHPFAGSWVANVARSKRHPANPFRSATLDITIDGSQVTLDDTVVDENGREERQRNVVCTDGNEQPSYHGYVLTAIWRGQRVLEIRGRKGTQDAGTVRYEVSPDGLTLTISDRAQEVVSVFDRR